MSSTNNEPLEFSASNGLNASTGEYFFQPQTIDEIAARAVQDYNEYVAQKPTGDGVKPHLDKDHIAELIEHHQSKSFAVVPWASPKNLSETGWGVIFPAGDDPVIRKIRDALAELLDLRKEQAGANKPHYYREFIGEDGYRKGMTKSAFLEKYGATFSSADPENVPYYLLIVGDPETIPFSFQYQLDVQYAVGRIYFETLEEYARYARSVVMAEKGKVTLPRRLSFFGTKNNDDPSTLLSSTMLISPLAEEITRLNSGGALTPGWQVETFPYAETKKERLLRLMGGADTPALLFTASHGAAFNKGDLRQLKHQGALICQDWPGPKEWGRKPIRPEHYLAGEDIGDDANPLGMITFHFACFGAGTPQNDDFSYTSSREIASHAFLAKLPQRLLGHPKGGALAVIGHVERAWDYSFRFDKTRRQTQTFTSALFQIMNQHPIGAAMEFMNGRYAELSTAITEYEHSVKQGNKEPNSYELAGLWMQNNDARSYVIIGDPAVRLVAGEPSAAARLTIEPITLTGLVTPPSAGTAQSASPQPASTEEKDKITDAASFGIFSSAKESKQEIQNSLNELLDKTKQTLSRVLSDATSLEVLTYVSDEIESVEYENGKLKGVTQLRAMTRIDADGDTIVCVPRAAGKMDTELWQVHKDMVDQALTHRTEMIKTLSAALAGLVDALKVL